MTIKRPYLFPIIAGIVALGVCGCNKTTDTGATSAVCSQWRTISWSSRDTPETIDGVKGNNARRNGWCG